MNSGRVGGHNGNKIRGGKNPMATKTDSTALQRLYAEAYEFCGVRSLRFISCLRYLDKMNTLLALLQEAAPGLYLTMGLVWSEKPWKGGCGGAKQQRWGESTTTLG